jgi:hypothetical protein
MCVRVGRQIGRTLDLNFLLSNNQMSFQIEQILEQAINDLENGDDTPMNNLRDIIVKYNLLVGFYIRFGNLFYVSETKRPLKLIFRYKQRKLNEIRQRYYYEIKLLDDIFIYENKAIITKFKDWIMVAFNGF